jgi:hypothetical protein
MEEKDKTISEAVKAAAQSGLGKIEVVLRQGETERTIYPEKLELDGILSTPSGYIEQRPKEFTVETSHAIVRPSKGEIDLFQNDRDEWRTRIGGRIEIAKEFMEIGINMSKSRSPEALAKFLKLKRSWFPDFASHAKLVAQLRNVKAVVNREVEKAADDRGNNTDNFTQSVESNMPDSFDMKIPIIQGEEPMVINVSVVLEATAGRDIVCFLESAQAQEEQDKLFKELIEQEVEKLRGKTTLIFQ